MSTGNRTELFDEFIEKASLKQKVYKITLNKFNLLKTALSNLVDEYKKYSEQNKPEYPLAFELKSNNEFEMELKFGGDVLVFMMHTNVFEFPNDHEVMKTSYVKEDKQRSFHGIINIYNFLADSFKYNRHNDLGYLIGRVFINKDESYFVEGKNELSFLYHNFGSKKFDESAVNELIEAAVKYSIDFDLLTPPYEQVMIVSVLDVISTVEAVSLKTGKRLGFKFYADNQNTE